MLAFKKFRNVDLALWQQLLGAVEDNFVQVKHRPHQGYSGYSTLDMLTQIYDNYAVISNADWPAKDKRSREAYAPTNPIKVVWIQINAAVAYTNSGSTPSSPNQVVENTYHLVFNTDIFSADCREWNKRAATDKTLPHLKVFFASAQREWCLSIQNEMGAPYGALHNAPAKPDDGYLQQETVDAIANLVTATASDHSAIAQLTDTVARLTTELATVNAKLVNALQKNRASRGI